MAEVIQAEWHATWTEGPVDEPTAAHMVWGGDNPPPGPGLLGHVPPAGIVNATSDEEGKTDNV